MESAKRERPLGLPIETSAASRITTPPHMPFSEPAPPLPEQLPNPMFLVAPAAEMSPRTPRFDNYMKPAPAFSGFKRKIGYVSPSSSTLSHFTRPCGPSSYHLGPNHPPAQQFQITQSPDYVPFPMPPQALQSSPWRSPVQFQTPFSGHHATCSSGPGPWNASTGSPAHDFNPNSSRGGFSVPRLGLGSPMSSGPGPWNASTGSPAHDFNPNSSRGGFSVPRLGLGSPMSSGPGPWNASTGSPHGFNPNSSRGGFTGPHLGLGSPMSSGPGPCNASTGSPAHGFSPNASRGGFRGPHFGQGGPTSNPGIRGSSHSYSGRGKGRQFSSSPNNRGRGGRGQRFKNPSGQDEPEHYYSKTMVEDPWRELKPIVGDILKPLYYSRAWLPKSLAESKSELNQIGVKSDSELSLAESLDISFKETIDGT